MGTINLKPYPNRKLDQYENLIEKTHSKNEADKFVCCININSNKNSINVDIKNAKLIFLNKFFQEIKYFNLEIKEEIIFVENKILSEIHSVLFFFNFIFYYSIRKV